MAETREHILTVTRLSSKDIEQDRRKTPFSFYTKHPQALFKQALLWWGMNSPVCEASSNSRLIRSAQPLSPVWLFVTPWTPAHQASLSTMNSQSLLKLMFIKSVMPSNHLNLYCPLLLSLSIFPSIRVFSNESVLRTPFPIWNQSLVPCPVLTVPSWPAYRFIRISWRICHSLLWSTQSKALA